MIESVAVSSRTRVTCYRVRLDQPNGVLLDCSAEELAPVDVQISEDRQEDDLAFQPAKALEEHAD